MDPTRSPFTDADEIFSAEMPSRLEHRELLIENVLKELGDRGCRPDLFLDRLCVDEAIANAVLHGNRGDPEKMVRVRAFMSDDRWGVEVADEGAGFDWRALKERMAKVQDSLEPSGRGLALMIASGAEVYFLDGGRRVLLVRQRQKA